MLSAGFFGDPEARAAALAASQQAAMEEGQADSASPTRATFDIEHPQEEGSYSTPMPQSSYDEPFTTTLAGQECRVCNIKKHLTLVLLNHVSSPGVCMILSEVD